MRRTLILGGVILTAVCLFGQEAKTPDNPAPVKDSAQPKPSPAALKEARHRFNLAATRAAANFRSADSIEANLRTQDSTLHPQINALRFRIEAALDSAEQALKDSDVTAATDDTKQAEQMLDRFARLLGGY